MIQSVSQSVSQSGDPGARTYEVFLKVSQSPWKKSNLGTGKQAVPYRTGRLPGKGLRRANTKKIERESRLNQGKKDREPRAPMWYVRKVSGKVPTRKGAGAQGEGGRRSWGRARKLLRKTGCLGICWKLECLGVDLRRISLDLRADLIHGSNN